MDDVTFFLWEKSFVQRSTLCGSRADATRPPSPGKDEFQKGRAAEPANQTPYSGCWPSAHNERGGHPGPTQPEEEVRKQYFTSGVGGWEMKRNAGRGSPDPKWRR